MELELLVKKKKKEIYFRVRKVVDALKSLSSDFIAPQLKVEAAGCSREMQTCNYHILSPQSKCSFLTFNMFGCAWSKKVQLTVTNMCVFIIIKKRLIRSTKSFTNLITSQQEKKHKSDISVFFYYLAVCVLCK